MQDVNAYATYKELIHQSIIVDDLLKTNIQQEN